MLLILFSRSLFFFANSNLNLLFAHGKNPLTFSDNNRDRVAALQLPLVGDRQGELVRSNLEARRCGNGTVCIFNLHAIGTPGGGAAESEDATNRR